MVNWKYATKEKFIKDREIKLKQRTILLKNSIIN